MKVERVLVPHDFSVNAHWAVDYAVRIAKAFGSRIDLLHAYSLPSSLFAPYDVRVPEEIATAVRETATRKLLGIFERVQAEGIPVDMHLASESPPEAIAAHAIDLRTDLIVMATRGLTGLRHVLLGSVAERTLRLTSCSVLTLRQATASVAHAHPRKILVPTDFSPLSERAFELAQGWAHLGDDLDPEMEIVLSHAHYAPSLVKAYTPAELRDGVSARLREKLEETAEPARSKGLRVTTRLDEGVSESIAILDAAEEEGCDLIAMGTHGRTGLQHAVLGSVAERVVRSAPCPTLTVRG